MIERVGAVIIKVSLRPSASVVDYLNTTSYSICDALFHNSALCFLSSETRHWLPNHCPITQLCEARLVSNKRSCRWWTSSGGATWLAQCVRPGLVSELHTKLDHWAEVSSEILSECGGVRGLWAHPTWAAVITLIHRHLSVCSEVMYSHFMHFSKDTHNRLQVHHMICDVFRQIHEHEAPTCSTITAKHQILTNNHISVVIIDYKFNIWLYKTFK